MGSTKKSKEIRVSVVMSVYNCANYLVEAIESILAQDYDNFEFIIVDDGSTDGSKNILSNYSNNSRILLKHQENKGLTPSLNLAIAEARGEYIARMDADDVSLPQRLGKEVRFLDLHREISLVSCWAKVINEKGSEIGAHHPATTHEAIKKKSFFSGQLCHPAVVFRKEIFKKLGGYNEKYKYAQDYELWLRFFKHGYKAANIPEYLLMWRDTKSGIGRDKFKIQRDYGLKARWWAIRQRIFPWYYIFFLSYPYLTGFIPRKFKDLFKNLFF